MSLRKKAKKIRRWQRWENKVVKIAGSGVPATPGSFRAYNSYVLQYNRKQDRKEDKE